MDSVEDIVDQLTATMNEYGWETEVMPIEPNGVIIGAKRKDQKISITVANTP